MAAHNQIELLIERGGAGDSVDQTAVDDDEVLERHRHVRHQASVIDQDAVDRERMLGIDGERFAGVEGEADVDEVDIDRQIDSVVAVAVIDVRDDLERRSCRRSLREVDVEIELVAAGRLSDLARGHRRHIELRR